MIKEILSDSDHNLSAMRVMAVIALIFGFIIALIGLCLNKDLSQVAILSGVFVAPAFAGKAVSKFAENP